MIITLWTQNHIMPVRYIFIIILFSVLFGVSPVAINVNGSGNEAGTITTTLTATDVDNSSAGDITFSIVSVPTNITGSVSVGSVTAAGSHPTTFTATATYTHDGSETTSDTLSYKAFDGVDSSLVEKKAAITITPVNDPPELTAIDSLLTDEDIPDTLTLHVYDPDNSSHTFKVPSLSDIHITPSISDSTLILIPATNWNGSADILVQVLENGPDSLSNSKPFNLTVNPKNDPPSAVTLIKPEEGNNITIDINNLNIAYA